VARGYEVLPIGITVEGANILTRNLIIFASIRCHPYLFRQMEAASQTTWRRLMRLCSVMAAIS
jgi:hypothetical protein